MLKLETENYYEESFLHFHVRMGLSIARANRLDSFRWIDSCSEENFTSYEDGNTASFPTKSILELIFLTRKEIKNVSQQNFEVCGDFDVFFNSLQDQFKVTIDTRMNTIEFKINMKSDCINSYFGSNDPFVKYGISYHSIGKNNIVSVRCRN